MMGPDGSRGRLLGAAVAVSLVVGMAGPTGPAEAKSRDEAPVAALQAPLIENVRPRDGAVEVAVELGDTAGDPVARVTVSARAVDDAGDPTGDPVATGGATATDPDTPPVVTISGLTNETTYAFEATQTTAAGTTSDRSDPVLGGPETPEEPLAPTLDSVFGRDQSLAVTWNPAGDGGSPVIDYTVAATPVGATEPGATSTVPGTRTSVTLTGLVNGTAYIVSVTARSAVGAGSPGYSDAETIGADADGSATPQPPYAADAPTDVSAGPPPPAADGTPPDPTALRVSWQPPKDNGGATIAGYTVTAAAAGQPSVTVNAPAGATQTDLTGLATDVEYSVTVATRTAGPAGRRRGAATDPASETVTAAAGPVTHAHTIDLSADAIRTITRVTGTTVVFTNPPAQVRDLGRHDVIVVGENSNPLTAKGLLRGVDSIAHDGDVWTLTTSDAALPQAFDKLDFTAAPDDRPAGAPKVRMLDPRFRAVVGRPIGGTLNIDIGKQINSDPKMKLPKGTTITAKLSAELSITPDWHARAGWRKDPNSVWYKPWTWWTFTYDFRAATTVKASVRGELGIAYKTASKKTPLLSIEPTACVWVYVVAFCPKLTVYTQTSVDGSIKFTFNASYERTMGGEVWRDATGRQDKKNLTTDPPCTKDPGKCFSYRLQAKAEVTIAFPIDLQVLIYKLVGPALTVTPALVLTADTAGNPWLKLEASLQVDIFFVVDLKIKTFRFGGTVYGPQKFRLWSASGPFTLPSLSPKPAAGALVARDATPIQYAVQWPDNCDPNEGVTWSMADGSRGTVDQTGRYTPPSPLPTDNFVDVIDAATAGTSTCPATTAQAAVHYGPSTPGSPRNVAISPDGTEVTWAPPADDGGSPVTGYIVSVLSDPSDPASSNYVLGRVPGTATSLRIPADRTPLIEWDEARVSVTAVNDRGQGPDSDPSPPAPSADLGLRLTATPSGGVDGTVTFTPTVVDLGPEDASAVRIRLTYPAGFTDPSAPANCATDPAARTVTCDLGRIANGEDVATPIALSARQLTVGEEFTVTATRTASTPYPADPHDGTDSITCKAVSADEVSCT